MTNQEQSTNQDQSTKQDYQSDESLTSGGIHEKIDEVLDQAFVIAAKATFWSVIAAAGTSIVKKALKK